MNVVVELLSLLIVFLCSTSGGSLFLQLVFVHNVRSSRERHLFSLIFGIVMTLYGVIFFDLSFGTATSWLSKEILRNGCHGLVLAQLILVAFVGPLWGLWSMVEDLTGGSRRLERKWDAREKIISFVSVVLLLALYYFSWRVLPSLEIVLDKNGAERDATRMEILYAKVAVFGTAGMGILSGYAAFSTPYSFLLPVLLSRNREQAQNLVGALQRRQRYLLQIWGQKKRQIALNHHQAMKQGGGGAQPTSGKLGWLASPWSSKSSQSGQAQAEQLSTECEGIERVCMSVFLQLNDAQQMVEIADRNGANQTRTSRLRRGCGVVFGVILSLYASGKIVGMILNFIVVALGGGGSRAISSSSGNAKVIQFVLLFSGLADNGEGPLLVSRASLVFSGVMIFLSIRGLLLTIYRLTTLYASTLGPATMVIGFSTFMGAYFTAQVLMLRLQLPHDSNSVLAEALSGLPLPFYQKINDVCFLLSCAVTFFIRRYVLNVDSFTVD